MHTAPTLLPSAPPAPEWDNCLTATRVLTAVADQSAASTAVMAMAVAEVVPSSSLPNEREEIEYAATAATATARPLPRPTVQTQTRILSEDEQRHRMESFTVNGISGEDGSQERPAANGYEASRAGTSRAGTSRDGTHGHDGRDATPSSQGEDAGVIDVSVSMTNTRETGKITVAGSMQKNAVSGHGYARDHSDPASRPSSITTYYVPVTTDFRVSAQGGAGGSGGRGGSGGSGSNGTRGKHAITSHFHGGNGGRGGHGGDAGAGSNGGDGGTGGKISIRVSDQDSYFLMAFPCCDRDAALGPAVRGGDAGREGSHGSPGTPGRGGKGGRSGGRPGTKTGQDGDPGLNGRRAKNRLNCGERGGHGNLTIHVDNSRQYPYRYDLQLGSVSIQSHQRLQELSYVFQFTDLIQIADITCQNVGGMISPIQGSHVHFKEQAVLKHIIPDLDTMGWLPERLLPEGIGLIHGKLLFRIQPPNIRKLGDDMEPFRVKEKLYLGATQLGSYGFQRTYPNFHMDGIMMDFRFPVENQTKLEGLPTIRAGSGMRVKFCVTNTSLRDLGVESQDGRKLNVQFYQNGREEYDIASHHIDLCVEGVQCKLEDNHSDALWRGTQFEIQCLKAGQTKIFNGSLKISPHVTPYSRLAIQAEILLEELRHSNLNEANLSAPKVHPVQLRRLIVISEPTYVPSQDNHAVLVSCASTTKEQFNAWSDLLTRRLGLNIEYYSVSIYGSLDPDFKSPNGGIELAQAFTRKLVVVLDSPFNPPDKSASKMEPSRMIPNGSQSQTSGYDKSTRWLMAGSSDDAVKQALLAHFTAPPIFVINFGSLSAFTKALKAQLQKERKEGRVSDERICEFVIEVNYEQTKIPLKNDKEIRDKKAKAVKEYLEEIDPLRQYVVEPQCKIGMYNLVVRRGYCRTANTTNVLKKVIPPRQNDEHAVFAVVGSLPLDTLHLVIANAVSTKDELLLDIALDTFTQHLLWEIANVLEGNLNVHNTEDLNAIFPTLVAITASSKLKQMAGGTGEDGRNALSKLLARLECVTNSRDLNPRSRPFSSRHAVRKLLLKMMATLGKDWAEITSKEERLKEVQRVEVEVLKYLRNKSIYPTFMTSASHWRKGLMYVCSYRNRDKYREGIGLCGPAIRLCEMETPEIKYPQFMRQQAQGQKDRASQLLKSIKDTRDRQELRNEEEFELF